MHRALLKKWKWRTISLMNSPRRLVAHLRVPPSSRLDMGKGVVLWGGKITLGIHSSVVLADNVKINANLIVGEGCTVSVANDCDLRNVTLEIQDHAIVEIGPGAILESPERYPMFVAVNHGALRLSEKVHVQAEILVRFGGTLTVGKYTSIGHGSEIRCEESVDIGEYGLVSYDVCIYDTDTHSTNWQERRERIEKGYPYGTSEECKPGTTPVRIGDHVWIGKGATILKGATIGHRCIVGIRTVVGGGVYEDDSVIVSDKPRVISNKKGG